MIRVEHGDSREVLKGIADASVDSVVTDPPYALVSITKRFGKEGAAPAKSGKSGAYARASAGFMGKKWDTGDTAFDPEFWVEVLRVLKPGGHVVAFGGTRTYHRLACAIEDAGFEIRDMLAWLYGSGFPKSHDVAKGLDAKAQHGSARTTDIRRMTMGEDYEPSGRGRANYDNGGGSQMNGGGGYQPQSEEAMRWVGWGTALKPAIEPICFARKPLEGTVAANVLAHGTGALNIDACRIESGGEHFREGVIGRNAAVTGDERNGGDGSGAYHKDAKFFATNSPLGRWPANVLHDGSDEVVGAFPSTASGKPGIKRETGSDAAGNRSAALGAESRPAGTQMGGFGDNGSAARFYYSSKADADDRLGSKHPTVKPVGIKRWLVRLVTPPGGLVLDPFAGSGTTGMACLAEGFDALLIEREAEYVADIRRRIDHVSGQDAPLFAGRPA